MELITSNRILQKTLQQRFMEKVDKKGENECWNWISSKNTDGYGTFYYNGKVINANRISWFVHCGEIPKGMHILHRCDNRICVNPKHLFLGTHQDNMNDRTNKDRGYISIGENNGNSKLTYEIINDIRNKYNDGKKCSELAKEYNITYQEIRNIVKNKNWKDNNYKPIHKHGNSGENSNRAKLTWDIVNQIRKRYNNGEPQVKLAKEFGISGGHINDIINNKLWKN